MAASRCLPHPRSRKWPLPTARRCSSPAPCGTGSEDENIRALAPELIVVVAYGCILPKSVLEAPKYGCINLHVSLLPKYRGSAPVQWAVLNGDAETGVSIMQMDEGLDTGVCSAARRSP